MSEVNDRRKAAEAEIDALPLIGRVKRAIEAYEAMAAMLGPMVDDGYSPIVPLIAFARSVIEPPEPNAAAALDRIRNSDASGIDHKEIYGYSVDRDLVILGRYLLSITAPTPEKP